MRNSIGRQLTLLPSYFRKERYKIFIILKPTSYTYFTGIPRHLIGLYLIILRNSLVHLVSSRIHVCEYLIEVNFTTEKSWETHVTRIF